MATSAESSPGSLTATNALQIAGRRLRSRLLLGTGGFPSLELMAAAIEASGSELVTVALRRVGVGASGRGGAMGAGGAAAVGDGAGTVGGPQSSLIDVLAGTGV